MAVSKPTDTHTHVSFQCSLATEVWGSFRLAPIKLVLVMCITSIAIHLYKVYFSYFSMSNLRTSYVDTTCLYMFC